MANRDLIQKFQEYLNQSRRIVFLTGAGISTESGIPDFRSADGLYSDPENPSRRRTGSTPKKQSRKPTSSAW